MAHRKTIITSWQSESLNGDKRKIHFVEEGKQYQSSINNAMQYGTNGNSASSLL